MSSHRGAILAFHNQIGFAIRRLKRGHKMLAEELLPASKELRRKVSDIIAEQPGSRIDTSWPSWKRKRKCTNGGRLTQTHIWLLNMRLTESSIFSALVCRSGSGRHRSTTKSKYLRTKLDETYAHRTKRSVNMLECANALKTCRKGVCCANEEKAE